MSLTPRLSIDGKIPLAGLIVFLVTCLGSAGGAAVQVGELKNRFEVVEQHEAKWEQDHDALISVQTDVRAIKAAVDRIEAHQRPAD